MKSFSTSGLGNRHVLARFNPQLLHEFLCRHRRELEVSGYGVPACAASIDCDALAGFFRQYAPTRDNQPLTEAIHLILGMSAPGLYEVLDQEAGRLGLPFMLSDLSEELALRIWLVSPEALERRQLESAVFERETYTAFSPRIHPATTVGFPGPDSLQQMASDLNTLFGFQSQRRWSDFRVFGYEHGGRYYFAIRRGDPFRLEPSVDDNGESGSTIYRPECFDVCRLHPVTGELEVNARTLTLTNAYLRLISKHLLGQEDLYVPACKYDLSPLTRGPAALSVADFAGELSQATLLEIEYAAPGVTGGSVVLKGEDVFATMRLFGESLAGLEILRAKFAIRFRDSARPRKLTLMVPGGIRLSRPGDLDTLERWLQARQIIIAQEALARAC